MNNRSSRWTRGKVLGGSSVLNYLLYFRGNKKDYDNWEALGNTGWSYNDVLPYFLKSEDNKNSSLSSTSYHSRRGYLTVSESSYETRLLRAFIAAGKELGYENRDNNGEFQTGFMKAQGKRNKNILSGILLDLVLKKIRFFEASYINFYLTVYYYLLHKYLRKNTNN